VCHQCVESLGVHSRADISLVVGHLGKLELSLTRYFFSRELFLPTSQRMIKANLM